LGRVVDGAKAEVDHRRKPLAPGCEGARRAADVAVDHDVLGDAPVRQRIRHKRLGPDRKRVAVDEQLPWRISRRGRGKGESHGQRGAGKSPRASHYLTIV
jgi:hypothetical protein